MIATTLMVGCLRAAMEEVAALQICQHTFIVRYNHISFALQNTTHRIITDLLYEAKLIKTSAVGCAAHDASMLQQLSTQRSDNLETTDQEW